MDTVKVQIAGDVSVPVRSEALRLVMEIDPAMHKDITDEAIRTAVSDKLGGFRDLRIARAPSAVPSSRNLTPGETVTAHIDFEALSRCIHQLVGAFDELATGADQLEAPVAVLESDTASAADKAAAVQRLREIVMAMRSVGPPVSAAPGDSENGQQASKTAVPATAGASGTDEATDAEDDDDGFDPTTAGYAPLLDADDDEDDEGVVVAANGQQQRPVTEAGGEKLAADADDDGVDYA